MNYSDALAFAKLLRKNQTPAESFFLGQIFIAMK